MKRQVQATGVRKWFGDDFINMQDELYNAIETGILGGETGIVQGIYRTQSGSDYTFSPGIVMINGKLHTFAGHTSTNNTIYIVPSITHDTRDYMVGGSNNITNNYNTEVVYTTPSSGDYVKCDNSSKNRFFYLKTDSTGAFNQMFVDLVNNFVASKYKLQDNVGTWTAIPGAKYATTHILGQPKYMIDSLGFYHFAGYWNCNEATLPSGDDYIDFMDLNLPTASGSPSEFFIAREIESSGTIKERLVQRISGKLKIKHLNDNIFGIDLRNIPPIKSF